MAADTFDVATHFETMKATGEAVLALKKARDLILMSTGNTLGAASLQLLYDGALGLVREMGAQFVAQRDHPDPQVRALVIEILRRLHGEAAVPVSVPSHGESDA
jgi:hypothetical protein